MTSRKFSPFDFINSTIDEKELKFGWRIEVRDGTLSLYYDILNFNWIELNSMNNEEFNAFLNSISYSNYKNKMTRLSKRHPKRFFSAHSISTLKMLIEDSGLKIDIDKLISKKLQKMREENEKDA